MQNFTDAGILFATNTLKNVFTNITATLGKKGGFVGKDCNSPEEIFYLNETKPSFFT